MEKNSGEFDFSSLLKIANSPAGQRLLSLVQKNRDDRFDQALRQAQSGDYTQAQQLLSKMLSTKEGQELMKDIRGEQ